MRSSSRCPGVLFTAAILAWRGNVWRARFGAAAVDGAEGDGKTPAPGAGSSPRGLLLPPGGKRSASVSARILDRASTMGGGVGLGVVTAGADVGLGGGAPPTEGGSPSASSSWFSFVSREDEEEAGAEFSLITMSDSSMSTSASPPVDSEEGGASGMSMRACTAGRESGSGEDRGRPSLSILWCTATGQGRGLPGGLESGRRAAGGGGAPGLSPLSGPAARRHLHVHSPREPW